MIPKLTTREAFLESILHDRHTIFGRELYPFCIDHWLILDALQSPLIHGGDIAIEDIQLAVKACSTSSILHFYEVSRRPSLGWKLWGIITKGFPLDKALSDFNRYIEDYIPNFPKWEMEESGESLKCPPLFVCAARFISNGHDPLKVRRMSLGEILCWNLAMDEAMGKPSDMLMSEAEIEAVEQIERESLNV